MDHMTKVIMPRIPHYIADGLEMRGDVAGSKGARNKADLVERFIEVRTAHAEGAVMCCQLMPSARPPPPPPSPR